MKTQQKKRYLRRRHRSKEKGQMMILSVLIIVFAVVPLSAIGVDLGLMQWQKAKLQRITDASALAGVQEMGKKQSANEPANTTSYRSAGVAINYARQNGLQINSNYNTSGLEYTSSGTKDSIDVQAGNYNVSLDTFTPYTTPVNALSIGVTRTVPVYFGRIFGISSTQIKSVAIARIGQAKRGTYDSYPGLLPIGLPYNSFDPDEMYQLKGINFEDAAPGYKGILNFDKRWWHCATWDNETEKWTSTYDSDGDGEIANEVDVESEYDHEEDHDEHMEDHDEHEEDHDEHDDDHAEDHEDDHDSDHSDHSMIFKPFWIKTLVSSLFVTTVYASSDHEEHVEEHDDHEEDHDEHVEEHDDHEEDHEEHVEEHDDHEEDHDEHVEEHDDHEEEHVEESVTSDACGGAGTSYIDHDNDGVDDSYDDDDDNDGIEDHYDNDDDGDGIGDDADNDYTIENEHEDDDDQHKGEVVEDEGGPTPDTWEDYVKNGYHGSPSVVANQRVDVIPGNHSGPFSSAIQYYIDHHSDTIIIPLVDDPQGEGTNLHFRIVKFAAFKVSSTDISSNTLTGQYVDIVVNAEIDDTENQTESDSGVYAVELVK